jgi:sec-independent protein translocase protein TatC
MSAPDELDSGSVKPFVEHLEDLRRAIIGCVVSLAIGWAIAVPLAPPLLEILKVPLAKAGVDPATFLRVFRVSAGLSVAVRIILWTGVLIASPGMVYAIGNFVFPGLTRREKRFVRYASAAAAVLFAGGVVMCYYTALPYSLRVMFQINRWLGIDCQFVEVSDYVSFIVQILVAFGLAFELPLVLLALGYMGIVNSEMLRTKRRHAIVIILIIAMVLTPPDVVSQIIMAIPLIVLYEICVWMIRARETARRLRSNGRPAS